MPAKTSRVPRMESMFRRLALWPSRQRNAVESRVTAFAVLPSLLAAACTKSSTAPANGDDAADPSRSRRTERIDRLEKKIRRIEEAAGVEPDPIVVYSMGTVPSDRRLPPR
jgi:hypothetical protein